MYSRSRPVLPTSVVTRYRPPRVSRNRPKALSMASFFCVCESAMMTALPPPNGRSAAADLYVIARDSRSTSWIACSSVS